MWFLQDSTELEILCVSPITLFANLTNRHRLCLHLARQSTAIQQAIFRDGEATRQLITSNRIADLEQQLTVAQLSQSEQRAINREIVNTNTITIGMNQQQAQQQQQMQALQWQLNQLIGGVSQFARATNSTVQVGNTGAVAGAQTANPTNVVA